MRRPFRWWGKKRGQRRTGSKLLGSVGEALFFGLLFFGLLTMERAVEPLRDSPRFLEWMDHLENPLLGAAIGAVVTVIVQSSSATVAMVLPVPPPT